MGSSSPGTFRLLTGERAGGVRRTFHAAPFPLSPATSHIAVAALLSYALLAPGLRAAQEPITETLLQQPSGAPAAGRLWPGFSAAQGLDTGATADPSGAKPEQIDTGATADPSGPAPEPITTSLTAPGLAAGSGGDLSSPTVPWMGNGATVANTAVTAPLTGGVPTYGGTSLGGGSPLAGGTSLAGFGNLAAGMLGQGIPGMGGMGGLAGLGMLGQIPGFQNLGNVMSMVGMLSILNTLPQMITQLPQAIAQSIQLLGPMALSLFQSPDMFLQSLAGTGQGLMGMGGQLGQLGQVAGALPGAVQGAAGGVAGNTPYQPQATAPQTPSGLGNTNRVGGFDTDKAWQKWQTDNAGSNYCGRGVYNILNEQGYNVIPGNGEDWNENLASLGWEKVKVSDPSQAPIGSVLVYEDSNGTSGGGAQWGHVEVVSQDPNGSRVYLAGTRSYNPGGTVPQNWDGYAWLPPGN